MAEATLDDEGDGDFGWVHLGPLTTGLPGKMSICRDANWWRLDAPPSGPDQSAAYIDAMMAWYALNQEVLKKCQNGDLFDEDLIDALKRLPASGP